MVGNIIKVGGYIMILNELANQVKKVRQSRERALRRKKTKNIAIGAGIGTAMGVAAGVLLAPKSGQETRQLIADRTGETVKIFKDNLVAAKTRLSASATETGTRLAEAGQKGVEAVKENLKKPEENKKKASQK